MKLERMPDAEEAAARAAAEITRLLEAALEARGVAHLALSGGTTPARTYELLGSERNEWEGIELWFADERCVAPEDELSNFRLVSETLLREAPVAAERVHRMEGELGPEEGARRYGAALAERVGRGTDGPPALDVALLGIGPDGHVASLFPDAPTLDAAEDAICLPVRDSPKPPPERITLSLPVLRAVRSCVLLATGERKADALGALLCEPSREVPASLLRRERLTVILDEPAATALTDR